MLGGTHTDHFRRSIPWLHYPEERSLKNGLKFLPEGLRSIPFKGPGCTLLFWYKNATAQSRAAPVASVTPNECLGGKAFEGKGMLDLAGLVDKEIKALEAETTCLRTLRGKFGEFVEVFGSCPKSYESFRANSPGRSKTRYFEWKGIVVRGDGPRDEGVHRDNSGRVAGSHLFLAAGGWVEVTYRGRWSRWDGATNRWRGEETPLSDEDVAREYRVPRIAEVLARWAAGFEKRAAERIEIASKATQQAEKILSALGAERDGLTD